MKNKIRIINPEKKFKKTPRKFGSESQILDIKKRETRSGVILDNLKEIKTALLPYTREMDHLLKNVQEFSDEVNVKGRSFISFDGASMDGERVGEKYVLKVYAAYDPAYGETNPEINMAKRLGKERALASSDLILKMSIVDDWWFNINLAEIFSRLPLEKIIDENMKIIARNVYNPWDGICVKEEPKISFKYKEKSFELELELDAHMYLRPEGSQDLVKDLYYKAWGTSLVGPAWNSHDKYGNKIQPRPEEPPLVFSVLFPKESYFPKPIIDHKQMFRLQKARNYLVDCIRSSLNPKN